MKTSRARLTRATNREFASIPKNLTENDVKRRQSRSGT
jgi:hypothetical protein